MLKRKQEFADDGEEPLPKQQKQESDQDEEDYGDESDDECDEEGHDITGFTLSNKHSIHSKIKKEKKELDILKYFLSLLELKEKNGKKKFSQACVNLVLGYFNKFMNGISEKIGDDYQNEKDDGQKVWHAERIGAGGFGTVLKVTKRNKKSKEIEITRAIKVIPNSTVGLSEAMNASTMKYHPNVVKVYNVMLIRHICCIEMEYIKCGSLADLIKKGVIVDNYRFRNMLFQCCEVLALMKQNGMVHSDIKPDNIMIRNYQDFDIAIGDFGLTLQNGTINKQVKGGTRHYWAPELKKKFKPTFHSDIYALGITFEKFKKLLPIDEIDYLSCFSSENTEERERAFYEFVYNDYKKKDLSIWKNDDKYVLKLKTYEGKNRFIKFLLGSKLRTNKKFIMDNKLYDYADLECPILKKDKEFMLEVIKQRVYALEHVDESLRTDREIVLEAIKRNGNALKYADESLRTDRVFVLEAVKQHGYALKYADDLFKKDREIVLEAVKQDGNALEYAYESLRKDGEIVLEAVKRNGVLEKEYESLRKYGLPVFRRNYFAPNKLETDLLMLMILLNYLICIALII